MGSQYDEIAVGTTILRESPFSSFTYRPEEFDKNSLNPSDYPSLSISDISAILQGIECFLWIMGEQLLHSRKIDEDEEMAIKIRDFSMPDALTISSNSKCRDISQFCQDAMSKRFVSCKTTEIVQDLAMRFIFACFTNAHQIPVYTASDESVMCALFEGASKFSHSCSPNCVIYVEKTRFDGDTLSNSYQAVVKTIKPMIKHDIPFISYLDDFDLLMPVRIRRRILWENKFFNCACDRCRKESIQTKEATADEISFYQRAKLFLEGCADNISVEEIQSVKSLSAETYYKQLMNVILAAEYHGRNLERLPSAILGLTRTPQLCIMYSCLSFALIFDNMLENNPVLAVRWAFMGESQFSGSMVPVIKWIDYKSWFLEETKPFELCQKSDKEHILAWHKVKKSIDEYETSGSFEEIDKFTWQDIEDLTRYLVSQSWSALKIAKKSGLMDKSFKLYRDDFLYLKSLLKK